MNELAWLIAVLIISVVYSIFFTTWREPPLGWGQYLAVFVFVYLLGWLCFPI